MVARLNESRKRITVSQLKIVKVYNNTMKGVDRADQNVSAYCITMVKAIVCVHVGPCDPEWMAAVSQNTILAAMSIGPAGIMTRRRMCISRAMPSQQELDAQVGHKL